MYQNFIFDMGNVIMDFSPDYILSRYTDNVADIEILKEAIFESDVWHECDAGIRTFAEAEAIIVTQVPEHLHALVHDFFTTWHHHKIERPQMTQLIKRLKDCGYGIYLCSNAASRFYEYKDRYPVFEYFDDFVISADLYVLKPSAEIYERVLERNQLKPETCLFIDDLSANIQGAKMCGISGYHYNGNCRMLEDFLETIHVF